MSRTIANPPLRPITPRFCLISPHHLKVDVICVSSPFEILCEQQQKQFFNYDVLVTTLLSVDSLFNDVIMKTKGFLTFSEGIEMEHWTKMG